MGASINASKAEVRNLINRSNAFDKDNPTLIISHWDIDHYQAILELDINVIRRICCVFVPNKLVTETSKRALSRLRSYCHYVVPIEAATNRIIKRRISLQPFYTGQNYVLFRGEKSVDTNKSGLALAIWNEQSCVILSGDHHYHQVFGDIMGHVPPNLSLNIVTPHHGGRAGKIVNPFNNTVNNTVVAEIAATSTGNNNYGHPLNEVRDELLRMGFKWLRTDYINDDIEITL